VVTPDRPANGNLHTVFEATAGAYPARPAVDCAEAGVLTYAQLDALANRIAHRLAALSIGPGDVVGLCLPRSAMAYAAILGVLKAGAAYVPLDPGHPGERMHFILEDSRARLLVVASDAPPAIDAPCPVLALDPAGLANLPDRPRDGAQPLASDLCYIIYTSGTTGRPKGVAIEHRAARHFVDSARRVYDIAPEDRVFQGFSLAFDASVEEVWLTFAAGACLVPASDAMVRSGPSLPAFLARAGITVLSCVPTLLSMMEGDIPSVRLLIVGGEACPPGIVTRWARPDRRLLNTYGPTEATVVATWAELTPGEPVTIGRPLPGYVVQVLTEDGRPAMTGEPGELLIGGPALARGYVNRPELTAEKFVTPPPGLDLPDRLYRTGDLVRWTAHGQLDFLGRIDGQVKIRGFRVELGEIEAALLDGPGVQAAAAAVHETAPGIQTLVGYVVPAQDAGVDAHALLARLRERLPAYMVPAILETLDRIPMMTSGKVDRRALPQPRQTAHTAPAGPEPADDIERLICATWAALMQRERVGPTEDFFYDLGGHSLLAAVAVSRLRSEPGFASLSVLDLYSHPTARRLGTAIGGRHPSAAGEPEPAVRPVTTRRWFLGGAIQAVALYGLVGLESLQLVIPFIFYLALASADTTVDVPVLLEVVFASLLAFPPMMTALTVAAKWLLLGRLKPGRHPLWGSMYLRWWTVRSLLRLVPVNCLAGTPILPLFLRAMGARIGRNVHVDSHHVLGFDLLSVGDDTVIESDTSIPGWRIHGGELIFGTVAIGSDCHIGSNTRVGLNTVVENGAQLGDLSRLCDGGRVPAGDRWAGTPARPVGRDKDLDALAANPAPATRAGQVWASLAHIAWMPVPLVVPTLASLPGIVLMLHLYYDDAWAWLPLGIPAAAITFVVSHALLIAGIKRVLTGRLEPGQHPVNSGIYRRRWVIDQLMALSLQTLYTLYSTVYVAPWLRLLGARIGRLAEVSTVSQLSPDLLNVGERSFLADSVAAGATKTAGGWVTLSETTVGDRAFVGNFALLPAGARIGDGALIGVRSQPPEDGCAAPGSAWLGSPPLFLPRRECCLSYSAESTYEPTRTLRWQRASIEFFRVIMPAAFGTTLWGSQVVALSELLGHDVSIPVVLAVFPAVALALMGLCTLTVVGLKWLLVGRYRPRIAPLWSPFVWRAELVTGLYEGISVALLLDGLRGTPFLAMVLRMMGARIGRRVFLDTTDMTEFDLVHIGDDVAIGDTATLQTHLFEDRVMKMDVVEVGSGCSVGGSAVVLYGGRMGEGSSLDELSLLMKGETLPAGSRWSGIPARAGSPG
jgi:non-ribosomal peptide synthetase-like protein